MTSQPARSPTVEKTTGAPLPPPPGADVEAARPASIFRGLSDIMKEDEERKKKVVVALRALTLLFSFLSFIIMATNSTNYYLNGKEVNFTIFEPFSYVLAIAIIVMVYTGAQTGIKIHQLCTGKELMAPLCMTLVDFIGDQIMAYLLISSASAATPVITTLKAMLLDKFTDQSAAAAVSMSYLAFFFLAPAALFSGFSLSMQLAR